MNGLRAGKALTLFKALTDMMSFKSSSYIVEFKENPDKELPSETCALLSRFPQRAQSAYGTDDSTWVKQLVEKRNELCGEEYSFNDCRIKKNYT